MALNRKFALITIIGLISLIANPPAFARKEIHRQNPDGSVSVEVQLTDSEKRLQGFEYQTPSGAVGVFFDEAGQPITAENYANLNATRYGQMIEDNGRILREMELAGVKSGDANYENIKRTNGMLANQVTRISNEVGQVVPFDSSKNSYVPISDFKEANLPPMSHVILNQKFDSNMLPGDVAFTDGENLYRKNIVIPGYTEIMSSGEDAPRRSETTKSAYSKPRVLVS